MEERRGRERKGRGRDWVKKAVRRREKREREGMSEKRGWDILKESKIEWRKEGGGERLKKGGKDGWKREEEIKKGRRKRLKK